MVVDDAIQVAFFGDSQHLTLQENNNVSLTGKASWTQWMLTKRWQAQRRQLFATVKSLGCRHVGIRYSSMQAPSRGAVLGSVTTASKGLSEPFSALVSFCLPKAKATESQRKQVLKNLKSFPLGESTGGY